MSASHALTPAEEILAAELRAIPAIGFYQALTQMFGNTPNFVEVRFVDDASGRAFAVTMQDVSGKTPSQLLGAVEAQRDTLIRACEAVLLFYSASFWSDDAKDRWVELTGNSEATTRSLCNFVRASLSGAK